MIKKEEESLTNWDMFEILKEKINAESKVLDLGTEHITNRIRTVALSKIILINK